MFSHQDWNPVVIHKRPSRPADMKDKTAINAAQRNGWQVETAEKKHTHGANAGTRVVPSSGEMRKLDNETENFRHERVPGALRKAIAQARQAKRMTQTDLARAIAERHNVIQDYESGKAIPNGQMLSKMSRVLGVNLRAQAMK